MRARIQTRELYRSSNGDRWCLARETDSGRVYVIHEPNLSSGGQDTAIELGTFLSRGGLGPEKQELLRLIGTLVDEPPSQEDEETGSLE